jgi:hypothetical protein
MNRWSNSLLQVAFAFVIVFLAGVFSISTAAIFRSPSKFIVGMAFLVAVFCLVLLFERFFPSVYSRSRRRREPWWLSRGVAAVVFGIIVSIFSSRITTLWFVLLIISGVLVALLLRVTRRDGEL